MESDPFPISQVIKGVKDPVLLSDPLDCDRCGTSLSSCLSLSDRQRQTCTAPDLSERPAAAAGEQPAGQGEAVQGYRHAEHHRENRSE